MKKHEDNNGLSMTQKGTHTWDIIVQYHRCPSCGMIIESRENYALKEGEYQKELTCSRCQEHFKAVRLVPAKRGFLTGSNEPASFEWD